MFDARRIDKNLHLNLCRHVRHAVGRQIAKISPHVSRRHLDVLHQLLLHLLDELLVLELVVQFVAHVVDTLLAVFLKLLLRPGGFYPPVDLLVDGFRHFRLRHFDGVDLCLMQKQLLHSQLLGNGIVGISTEVDALGKSLHAHLLHIRLKDRLVAHHPDHLVDDAVLGYGGLLLDG